MFFTNGGVESGTPVWLLLGTIYIAIILEGTLKYVMLVVNMVVMIGYFIIGYLYPSLIETYTRGGNYFDTMAAIFIVSWIIFTLISFQLNLSRREEADKNLRKLFEQTATALVNAIDAKDKYTHGHSSRVAEYSKKIAEQLGKSPRECDNIYYVALLHDVGKIGIPERIINKEGKLTDEEYGIIKQHPELGAQILQSITEIPFISIGAHFHHERYDGKGYPMGLKGTDIPEYARIISVADAYDAMTSKRSYRETIPQQEVREEFVKGSGTQFDPDFARIMVHLIDIDSEYDMKEHEEVKELAGRNELIVKDHRDTISDGILLTPALTTITMRVDALKDHAGHVPAPSLVLFDSLDGHYHDENDENREDMLYFEYGEIGFDGHAETIGARRMVVCKLEPSNLLKRNEYRIEAVRIKDHALIRIIGREEANEIVIALPDSARFSYIGLTGKFCHYSHVKLTKAEEECDPFYIPRIAEEISYINVPAGDIPNIQVDGYRTASSEGIPITDGMQISFHTRSLPTARLVWHCAYLNVFTSEDGTVNGKNYKDYMLMRLDGECWEGDPGCDVTPSVNRNDEFGGWDAWKKYNKTGYDCKVTFERHENVVIVRTENAGISLKNIATVNDNPEQIYVALTGDQCAITNIRIHS
ncbi:MAG: HD-GYP domain-containing protein [Lachnospiraceae bacterium]|nr:HD-GYP domain-containing protein [Lachnospiraceae bacterium]